MEDIAYRNYVISESGTGHIEVYKDGMFDRTVESIEEAKELIDFHYDMLYRMDEYRGVTHGW